MRAISSTFLALALLAVGCATGPRPDLNIDWSKRVGAYTYDQAVAELGNPYAIGESTDGKTADWLIRLSPRVSFGFGVGHSVYGPHSGMGMGVGTTVSPPPKGEYLRLTFGADGQLKAWSKIRY
jgi:hypothetical protein